MHLAVEGVEEYDIQRRIKTLLQEDNFFNQMREGLQQESNERKCEGYQVTSDNMLLYNNRFSMLELTCLKKMIMDVFHRRSHVGHLGYQKMVTTMRQLHYCPRMKEYNVEYITKCLECQQMKVEHKHLVGLLQPLPIP